MEYVNEWVRGIVYYMILVTAILQVTAGTGYRKYIRLFTGMILVLMILDPLIRIFGISGQEESFLAEEKYEAVCERALQKIKELEQETKEVTIDQEQEAETAQIEGKEDWRIEVEEIRIGR